MTPLVRFERYVGIDYSGAKTPLRSNKGLQVYLADSDHDPQKVPPPSGARGNWSRKEIAHWLAEKLMKDTPTLVGSDHGFSFPTTFLDRYGLADWDQILMDFCQHWATDGDNVAVDDFREGNARLGSTDDGLRLTERWTSSAKSVFQFDVQGSVAKSTHAGIPWLRFLRKHPALQGRVHFWPFDGFEIERGRSAVVEVYPSILRRRYPKNGRTGDEQDAYAVTRWLKEVDTGGFLDRYLNPPLSAQEKATARREGWILGIG